MLWTVNSHVHEKQQQQNDEKETATEIVIDVKLLSLTPHIECEFVELNKFLHNTASQPHHTARYIGIREFDSDTTIWANECA